MNCYWKPERDPTGSENFPDISFQTHILKNLYLGLTESLYTFERTGGTIIMGDAGVLASYQGYSIHLRESLDA